MILEYGHWADTPLSVSQQLQVFNTYYAQLAPDLDSQPDGFVAATVWWSLDDYWTERPGITIETFGLYRPDGTLRPAGVAASRSFTLTAPSAPPARVRSKGVAVAIRTSERQGRLLAYIGYAVALPAGLLIAVIAVLSTRRRRAW
jgi:hypothetical protein